MIEKEKVSIEYKLPTELVGYPAPVKFEGAIKANGTAELSGLSGAMKCKSVVYFKRRI
ncbi:MAG: hypothetical protein AB7O96_02115 [Pseudobdellovibrionaceae bacterium]